MKSKLKCLTIQKVNWRAGQLSKFVTNLYMLSDNKNFHVSTFLTSLPPLISQTTAFYFLDLHRGLAFMTVS